MNRDTRRANIEARNQENLRSKIKMSNKLNLNSWLKDMNACVKRIHSNPDLISSMNPEQLDQLSRAVEGYNPKSEETKKLKTGVMAILLHAQANGSSSVNATVSDITMTGMSEDVAYKIAQQTCVLEIHTREPTYAKKVDSSQFLEKFGNNGNISSDRLRVSKQLIDRKEIATLRRHRYDFLKRIKNMSLPGGMLTLGNGQRLIPISLLPQIREIIDTYLSERETLLLDFESRYPEVIDNAKIKLGAEFDAADYPEFSVIRSKYSTDYKFISNTVPEQFERVSREIYEQEQSRIVAECAIAAEEIKTALTHQFSELIDHMSDRLGTDEVTGKPKQFQKGSVESIKEFVGLFKNMNLTGDTELEVLVEKTKAILDGVDPSSIRKDKDLRSAIADSFSKIKVQVDTLIKKRARKVTIEDE